MLYYTLFLYILYIYYHFYLIFLAYSAKSAYLCTRIATKTAAKLHVFTNIAKRFISFIPRMCNILALFKHYDNGQ